MGIMVAGECDIGRVRKSNQDAIYIGKEHNFFLVADGMGGHSGGDIASKMAIKLISESLSKISHDKIELPVEFISSAVNRANRVIKDKSFEKEELQGMGTTVVGMFFHGQHLYILNVGDSRGYVINRNRLYQLTRDHSLVQEKLNLEIYNRDQAHQDPQKNVLVRCVGFDEQIDVDVFTYKVSKYDIFLLCSDGLHGKVSDADILYIINKYIPDPKKTTQKDLDKAVSTLVAQANANGGSDNISVILMAAI